MFDQLNFNFAMAPLLILVTFIFMKGEEPERIAGGGYVLAWLAWLFVQAPEPGAVSWGGMGVETAMLAVYAALGWKSRRLWLMAAAALQALAVVGSTLLAAEFTPGHHAAWAMMNIADAGVLLAIAAGVVMIRREPRGPAPD